MSEDLNAILKVVSELPLYTSVRPLTVNSRNCVGDTPLHAAATWGDCDAIRTLVEAGAEVNVVGELGDTPLHDAALQGNRSAFDLLLSLGADSKIRNSNGASAFEVGQRLHGWTGRIRSQRRKL